MKTISACVAAMLAAGALAQPSAAFAQQACTAGATSIVRTTLTGPEAARARLDELAGKVPSSNRLLRGTNGGDHELVCDAGSFVRPGSGFRILPLSAGLTWNSGYSTDRNNGALWEGRGVTAWSMPGVRFEYGPVTAHIAPVLAYVQNDSFAIVPRTDALYSPYAYRWRNFDLPQRFGNESFTIVDAGNSFIRVASGPVAAELSTANMWWGPGERYSVLMTNTAPGVPRIGFGTNGDVATPIGRINVQAMIGRLSESDYFDTLSTNDTRVLVGALATWQPRWVANLYVGGGRVQENYPDDMSASDYFGFVTELFKKNIKPDSTGSIEGVGDQVLALFFRWGFPDSELEIYGEWGRNDHAWDFDDFVSEPDHAAAILLGLQKGFAVSDARMLKLTLETIRLGGSRGDTRRGGASWYRHSRVRQGYTHQGQWLGSSIGGESDAQYMSLDMFSGDNTYGLYLERERRQDDVFISLPRMFSYAAHDLELTAGARVSHSFGDFRVTAQPAYSSRSNRLFRFCNSTVTEFRDCRKPEFRDPNFQLPISVTWYP